MSEIKINEKSAGAVIFRKEQNEALFLLLHYPSGHWDFVKGKIEPEENLRQTILRETREETGITDLDFLDGFEESVEYDFQYDGKLIHKKVIFYLAKTNTKKITKLQFHMNIWILYG